MMKATGILSVAAVALALAVTMSEAQQPQAKQTPTTRIRGQIEKVDGQSLTIKARDGSVLTVKLADNPRVMAMEKASLADVKVGSFIGVTAMPQADGTQKAIAVHIFLDSQRGVVADRFGPWDLRPGSTMTNANVESSVTSVDGQVLMVKYKDGEKKVLIPSDTPIVKYVPGNRDEVKAGAQIIIMGAQKAADGTFTTPAINVGRGVTPPM
jgi:hypothetical protein